MAKNEIFADSGKNSNIYNCSRSSATNQLKSVLCHTTSSANLGRKNTIEGKGVFMLQKSTLLCENHVVGQSKTNVFASNNIECKTIYVCFDE